MVAARRAAEVSDPDILKMADLMLRFESIGIDCQFGAVQRCCGVEPLGLFRFTASSIGNLATLLEDGLADFLTADDLGLEVRAGEYMIFSRRFGDFSAHTNVRVEAQDAATVVARQTKKADYLRKRFELDWRAAERIYVHCGCDDEAALSRLHAALRRVSDCWLLWVTVASRPEDRGHVEVLGPGFLKGHLAHAGGFDDWGFYTDLPGWASVCRAAEAIVRGSPVPPPLSASPIEARFAWAPAPCGAVECGATVGRCRILHDSHHSSPAAKVAVTGPFEAKSLVVASVWVRLSPEFQGRNVMLTTRHVFPVNYHHADVSVLDAWQQIWVVMRIPTGREGLTLSLDVEAQRSSELLFAGWQIEHGGIPSESLRPGWDTRAPDADSVALAAPVPRAPGRLRHWAGALMRRAADTLDPESEVAPKSEEDTTLFDFLRLSNLLMQHRRHDEADAVILAGKSLYPWRPEFYSHYAVAARVRGDIPMTATRWSAVVDGFPQYALSHYRLAAAWRELGNNDRALAVIEAALPRHLDDPGMVAEAARVFATAQRWSDAVAQWDRAVALAGDKPEWRDARAHAARMAATASVEQPAVSSG